MKVIKTISGSRVDIAQWIYETGNGEFVEVALSTNDIVCTVRVEEELFIRKFPENK